MGERFDLDEEVRKALEEVSERWGGVGISSVTSAGEVLVLPMRVATLAPVHGARRCAG